MSIRFIDPWNPQLNWDTEPGKVLMKLVDILPQESPWLISVFGSAPLEMGYSQSFMSNDVDVTFAYEKLQWIESCLMEQKMTPLLTKVGIQPCIEGAFRTSPKWKDRAFSVLFENIHLRFAHPIDILIGKIHRLDEKDYKAFEIVFAQTGEPTETTMMMELIESPNLFSNAHYDDFSPPFWRQVERLWERFYGRKIDVKKEILSKSQEILKRDYHLLDSYKNKLRKEG